MESIKITKMLHQCCTKLLHQTIIFVSLQRIFNLISYGKQKCSVLQGIGKQRG